MHRMCVNGNKSGQLNVDSESPSDIIMIETKKIEFLGLKAVNKTALLC